MLDEQALGKIITKSKYAYARPNEFIIKEGEVGNTFYILLSGQAGVLKKNPDYIIAKREVRIQKKAIYEKLMALENYIEQTYDDNATQRDELERDRKLMEFRHDLDEKWSKLKKVQAESKTYGRYKQVGVLEAGSAFGELALLYK